MGKRIFINKVTIVTGIALTAFMFNGQPFSDTSSTLPNILNSVNVINEDTLSFAKQPILTKAASPITQHSAGETV
jgi:hypothetical protein